MSFDGRPPQGRLELTWTNKSLRLLAHEDGSYEWTDPGDHRVAEVRLLHDATTIGQVEQGTNRAADNLLIRGDALHALMSLTRLPEFAEEYLGKVALAYLDPPFNTQRSFLNYDDALEHSVWLTMMRDRLTQIKTLLAPHGAVYVHCDASEGHYLKVLMDEVFGRANFRNEIVWKRTAAHSDSHTWSQVTDSILFYTNSPNFTWNPQHMPHSEEYVAAKYSRTEPDGRCYGLWDLQSPNPRPNLMYTWKGFSPPRFGWRYSPETMAKLHAENRIWYPDDRSKRPRLKKYIDESKGKLADNMWIDIPPVNSQAREDTRYDTQKPEALIERIIAASSNPGDIVLDCFLGSGTTAAVAHKMGRRWVGVERSREAVSDFAAPRLTEVIGGKDLSGISKAVGWTGGGGFRVLDVSESMFSLDGDRVVLASWATGGALAEAVCAQGSWESVKQPPFCGRKGRMRLAVIDGLVSTEVVLLLAGWLERDELLTVYGTAVDPAAREALGEVCRGGKVRQVPQSILADYRRQWRSEFAEWLNVAALELTESNDDVHVTSSGLGQ
ncbi:MAG TPA: DNA methyltransferase [Pseudonocardiaceae bacterium]|nr:DNA methyltransferase [Pseudonocardiaceae bacterium]